MAVSDEQLKFIVTAQDQASAALKQISSSVAGVGTSAKQAESGLLAYGKQLQEAIQATVGAIASAEAVKKALGSFAEYEQGLIRIGRTGALSGDQLKGLGDDVLQLTRSLPQSSAQLLSVADAAAKAGLSGRDNLKQITEYMGKLGEISDMSAGQIASAMLRITMAAHRPLSEVEKLGNAFAALKDKTQMSPQQFAQMSSYFSGQLSPMGVSPEDAMAITATMGNVSGGRPEMALMSMSMMMSRMQEAASGHGLQQQEEMKNFAIALQMSADAAKKFVEANPEQAFFKLIDNLGKAKQAGTPIDPMLRALGLSAAMFDRGLLPLATHMADLTKNMELANDPMRTAAVVHQQVAAEDVSLQHQLEITGNSFKELSTTMGGSMAPAAEKVLKDVRSLIQEFIDWQKGLSSSEQAALSWGLTLGPAILGISSSVRLLVAAFGPIPLALAAISTAIVAIVAHTKDLMDKLDTLSAKSPQYKQALAEVAMAAAGGSEGMPVGYVQAQMEQAVKNRVGASFDARFGAAPSGFTPPAVPLTADSLLQSRMAMFALPQIDWDQVGASVKGGGVGNMTPTDPQADAAIRRLEAQIQDSKEMAAMYDKLNAGGQNYGKTLAVETAAIKEEMAVREQSGNLYGKLTKTQQEEINLAKQLAIAQDDLKDKTQSWQSGMNQFVDDYQKTATNYGKITQDFMKTTTQSIENSIVSIFSAQNAQQVQAAVKQMVTSILQEFMRLYLIRPLLAQIMGFLPGLGLGGVAGGGGGVPTSVPSLPSALGNVFGFASGGAFTNMIVATPTMFKYFAGGGVPGLGVMGEAGPEAVMPLARAVDGSLGVRLAASPGAGGPGGGGDFHYSPAIHIGVGQDGRGRQDASAVGGVEQAHRLGAVIDNRVRTAVVSTITEQMRPGGLLWNSSKNST